MRRVRAAGAPREVGLPGVLALRRGRRGRAGARTAATRPARRRDAGRPRCAFPLRGKGPPPAGAPPLKAG
eukprot:10484287-Lingulodinium_polyedra.AAC.1